MIRHSRAGLATLCLGGAALAGCGTGAGATHAAKGSPTTQPSGAPAATVDVRSTSLGRVLTTSTGQVIYLLTADRPGVRSCTATCLTYWPPVVVHGPPSPAAGSTARLGEIGFNGGQQLTVDGYPAYTYVGDSSAGQTTGEGVRSFGGTWWVLSPAGTAITRTAAVPTTTSGGNYGGY